MQVRRKNQVGCYALGEPIAAGGMATVHLGRLVASAGFSRTVAIKRLHPHLAEDPLFAEGFADEARLVARIRHPNVAPTLDVVRADGELLIVMEYIDGESLSALSRGRTVPLPIIVAIVSEMLYGLHAAHEAKSEAGESLGIVHRDVSPQNVIVGTDGVARLLDFGIARTTNRHTNTRQDEVKGKLAYMAPEQIRREAVTRKTDIFAAGVVLWELLTGQRLFASDNEGATIEKILVGWVQPPTQLVPGLPSRFDDIALRALDADPNNRFETAREMAIALEDALGRALGRDVGAWVEEHASGTLEKRRKFITDAESSSDQPAPSRIIQAVALPDGDQTATIASAPPELMEPERTMTTFADHSANLRWVTASGTRVPPQRKRLRLADRIALGVFLVAVSLTAFFGMRNRFGTAPAPVAAANVAVATATTVPAPTPNVLPTPVDTGTAVAPVPSEATNATITVTPMVSAHSPGTTTPPGRRIVVKPARPAAPAKAACISKLDPATGKRVYQGDCD